LAAFLASTWRFNAYEIAGYVASRNQPPEIVFNSFAFTLNSLTTPNLPGRSAGVIEWEGRERRKEDIELRVLTIRIGT